MARPKKMDDDTMLALAQQYYAEKCYGNVGLLTFPKIGEYIRTKGYCIQDHLIRRNEKIRNYIYTLKEQNEKAKITTVSVFKDMDIDDFLKKNRTTKALRTALVERQNYYMELAHSASLIFDENKKLKKKVEDLEKEISSLEQELESKDSVTKDTLADFHEEKRRVRVLKEIVDTYVYPEIANELLTQRGILKKTDRIIDPKVLEKNILKPSDDISKYENKLIKGLFNKLSEGDNK